MTHPPTTRTASQPVAPRVLAAVRSQFGGGLGVWMVIGVLSLAATASARAVWDVDRPQQQHHISLWVMIVVFAFVEAFPIHVQFRSESSSFSLFEVPLVIGILLSDVPDLLLAVAVGSSIALIAIRRQPFAKLLFNAANQVLQVAVTVLVFNLLLGSGDPLSMVAAMSLLGAAVVASALGVTAIATVIAASERRLDLRKTFNMLLFGVIVAGANVSLGLIAVVLSDSELWTVGLLAIPLTVMYGSYHAYVSERTQREQIEFLYSSTKALQSSDDAGHDGITALLDQARSMFRATRTLLIRLPLDESPEAPVSYSVDSSGKAQIASLQPSEIEAAVAAAQTPRATLVAPTSGGALRAFIDSQNLNNAMLSVLSDEHGPFALLVAGDRVGNVTAFNDEDLRLFETLGFHAAAALENDRLETVLAQLQVLQAELSHQATHDTLTGMPNRLRLQQQLAQIDEGEACTVDLLLLDLDDFKVVNDTLGHGSGDDLLIEIATRIQSCLGKDDLAARLGGDEFAIITRHGAGPSLAQRILGHVQRPVWLGDTKWRINCSIGVAASDTATTTARLLRDADVAMYAAKAKGKGCSATYAETPALPASAPTASLQSPRLPRVGTR